MKKQEIIKTLKNSYSREIRKKIVKSILADEKENAAPNYKLMNQIFSYVLGQLGWEIAKNTLDWNKTPLDIMLEVFPSIEKTNWYKEQLLTTKKNIDVEMQE